MKREEIRGLLGGYATGSLSDAERRALFEAALDDQELFDELAREQALKELVETPGAKQRLLAAVSPKPWWRQWWVWYGSAATAVAVAAGIVLLMQPAPKPVEVAEVQAPQTPPAPQPAPPPAAAQPPAARKAAPETAEGLQAAKKVVKQVQPPETQLDLNGTVIANAPAPAPAAPAAGPRPSPAARQTTDAALGFAQVSNGTITGTVTDPAGAIITGAKVDAKNTATGAVFSAASNSAGVYAITDLPAGSYSINSSVAGFKTYTETNVAMQGAQILRKDIPMQAGASAESVTVAAEAPLLKAESGNAVNRSAVPSPNQPLKSGFAAAGGGGGGRGGAAAGQAQAAQLSAPRFAFDYIMMPPGALRIVTAANGFLSVAAIVGGAPTELLSNRPVRDGSTTDIELPPGASSAIVIFSAKENTGGFVAAIQQSPDPATGAKSDPNPTPDSRLVALIPVPR